MNALGTDYRTQAWHLQRLAGLDIDHRTDTAGRHIGAARLIHLNRRDTLRGNIAEIKGASAGSRHLTTVKGNDIKVRTKPSNGDLGAFAAIALDGYTGNPLQGFSQVGVREFTNIFRRDTIDNTFGVTLNIH